MIMPLKKGDKIRKGKFVAPEIFEGRKLTKIMFEGIIHKYMNYTFDQLSALIKTPGDTPAIELLVIGIMARAIGNGDVMRAEFILNRCIGKVKDVVEIEDVTNKRESELLAEKLLEAIKK